MVLSILFWRVCGLPARCVASVPDLNVLVGETLLNQDEESLYFIVMYFQSVTYTCISTSVCQSLQRAQCSQVLWFIHTALPSLCLTGSRYHARLKVIAFFDRQMHIFLRICCSGCSLKWSVRYLLDVYLLTAGGWWTSFKVQICFCVIGYTYNIKSFLKQTACLFRYELQLLCIYIFKDLDAVLQ